MTDLEKEELKSLNQRVDMGEDLSDNDFDKLMDLIRKARAQ